MKTRFGKDVDGPFVEATFTLRDQDDSPEFNFYSLSPDDRTKLCEHLPRKVNGLRAQRDHSEAEPAGHRVAALLRAVEEERADAERKAPTLPGGRDRDVLLGRFSGLHEAASLITERLAAPSPLDLAAAEACAVPPVKINDGPFGIEIDALNTITDLAMKSGHGEPREWLLKIAHVALRALACDAADGAKGGA